MTVIAWDGRTLAADRMSCNGMTAQPVTKIWRHGAELIGVCGDLSIGMEMLAWYRSGAAKDDFPASNRDPSKGASLVVITRGESGPECWKFESGPHAFRLESSFAAFGSGDEPALVAMACGKTAAEAVELVCRFNSTCGGGIDVLELT